MARVNTALKKVLDNPEVFIILRPDATIPIRTNSEQEVEMFRVNREHLGKSNKTPHPEQ
jgi:hypothetical protein